MEDRQSLIIKKVNKLAKYYFEIFKYINSKKISKVKNILDSSKTSSKTNFYLNLSDYFVDNNPLFIIKNGNNIKISFSDLVSKNLTDNLIINKFKENCLFLKEIWRQKKNEGNKQLFLCFPFIGILKDDKLIYTPLYQIEVDIDEDITKGNIIFKLESNLVHLNIYGLRSIIGDDIDEFIGEQLTPEISVEDINEEIIKNQLRNIIHIIKLRNKDIEINIDINSIDFTKVEALSKKEEFIENKFYIKNNYIVWLLDRFDFHLEKAFKELEVLDYFKKDIEDSCLSFLSDEIFNENDKSDNLNESDNFNDFKLSLFLNKEQKEVIYTALKNSITIIQGPPGTGKSHTITHLILELFEKNYKVLVTSYKPKALEVIRDKLQKLEFLEHPMFVFWLKGDKEGQRELIEKLNEIKNFSGFSEPFNKNSNKLSKLIEHKILLKNLFNEIIQKEKIFGYAAEKVFRVDPGQNLREYTSFVSLDKPKEITVDPETLREKLTQKNYNDLMFKIEKDLKISYEEFIKIDKIFEKIVSLIKEDGDDLYSYQELILWLIKKANDESFIKFRQSLRNKLEATKKIYESLEEENKTLVNNTLYKLVALDLNNLNYLQKSLDDLENILSKSWQILNEEYFKLDMDFLKNFLMFDIKRDFFKEIKDTLKLIKKELQITFFDKIIDLFNKERLNFRQKNIQEKIQQLLVFLNKNQDILKDFDMRDRKKLGQLSLSINHFYNVINFLDNVYILQDEIEKFKENLYSDYISQKITENCLDLLDQICERILKNLDVNLQRYYYNNDFYESFKINFQILNYLLDFYIEITGFMRFLKDYSENEIITQITKQAFVRKVDNSFWEIYSFYNVIFDLSDLLKNFNLDIRSKISSIFQNKHLLENFYSLILKLHNDNISLDDFLNLIISFEILNEKVAFYTDVENKLNQIKSESFVLSNLQYHEENILVIIKNFIIAIDKEIEKTWGELITLKNNEIYYLVAKNPKYNLLINETIKLLRKTRGRNAISIEELKKTIDFERLTDLIKVWVVNLNEVFKIFPTDQQFLFDYVIIDEASQVLPLYILPLMYIGKRIIVVGDDKQLKSPELIFFNEAYNESVLKQIGFPKEDKILSQFLIDKETSILKIFSSFQSSIMLREHFRCLPEIIKWSNEKFYGGKLKIMTEGAQRLGQTFDFRFINDAEESNQINRKEAEVLISDLISLLKKEEYRNYSFGVLSLFHEQADYLQYLFVKRKMEDVELNQICKEKENKLKEPVIVSTVDGFQGDERDIILYSFRYAPNSSPQIFALQRGEGGENRINVAFTRARKKMVFYISRPLEEFPPGLVKNFLLDAKNPHLEVSGEEKFDSDFEKDVYQRLGAKGYNVIPQYKSCGYFIDLAIFINNQKIGIECDGWQHYDKYGNLNIDDIERQEILERAGWIILRIPSSIYWQDPDGHIDNLCKRIEEIKNKQKIFLRVNKVSEKEKEVTKNDIENNFVQNIKDNEEENI